jgi:DNA modification methylase
MYCKSENFTLYHGDNRQILPTFAENSVDAIVTDPPYELGFMGKSWDASGVAFDPATWREALRVLKAWRSSHCLLRLSHLSQNGGCHRGCRL